MSMPIISATEQRWNTLQEGAVRNGAPSHFLLLLSALDQGWSIRQPVKVYPNPIHPESPSYHISLERQPGRQKRVLSLPQSSELDQYLQEENIAVKIRR